MTPFVIEKGIPFPPESYRGGGRPLTRDWNKLEIGDSVLVPSHNAARGGVHWGARHGRIFILGKQQDGSGWRVWRKT